MIHILIHIIVGGLLILNLTIISLMIAKKFLFCKNCDKVIRTLDANLDLLNLVYEKQHHGDLRKMIELYSNVQMILKLTESSFISLFRYDYSKKYIILHFMFSINKTGEIIHESYLDNLPATSNMLNLEIMKSSEDKLHTLFVDDIKDVDIKIYQNMRVRNIHKIYFKNLMNGIDSPIGYVSFCYENDYILDEHQQEETLRLMKKISDLL